MSISNRGKVAIALSVLVVLAGGAALAAVRIKSKYIDPQPVTQPIDFNHKLHMDKNADLTCETCHKGVADSRYASIPAVTTCVKLCHSEAPEGCTHPD